MPASKKKSTSNSSKKNTTRKNTSAKGRTPGNAKKAAAEEKNLNLLREFLLLAPIMLSVLIFLSELGKCGAMGDLISVWMFGCFGLMAYVFPFMVLIGCILLFVNSYSPLAIKKTVSLVVLFIALCGMMQILQDGYRTDYGLADYYHFSSFYHRGGGFVGGIFALSAANAFGYGGSIVILILLCIVCMIMITQKSLLDFAEDSAARLGLWIADHRQEYEEMEPEREEMRQLRARNRQLRRKEKNDRKMERIREEEARIRRENQMRRIRQIEEQEAMEPQPAGAFLEGTWLKPTAPGSGIILEGKAGDGPLVSGGEETAEKKRVKKKTRPVQPAAEEEAQDELVVREVSRGTMEIEIHRGSSDEVFEEPEEAETIERVEPVIDELEQEDFVNKLMEDEAKRAAPDDDYEGVYDDAELPSRSMLESTAKESGEALNKTGGSKKDTAAKTEAVDTIMEIPRETAPLPEYVFPSLDLLKKGNGKGQGDSDAYLKETAMKLQNTLHNFGVRATVTNISCGPTVTQYELQPEMGVKVSRIVGLADDIKLNLAAPDIRIEAPIPGKAAVGIEVPNKETTTVMLRDLLCTKEFSEAKSRLAFAVGKNIAGETVVTDIAKMPHLLIAGSTGSGKSVCINTLIMSILYKAKPDEVKLIMIDPKVVELSVYDGIPHLLIPVVTDPKKASAALNWAVAEMTRRYNVFHDYAVRNIGEYNKKVQKLAAEGSDDQPQRMEQIVIIVDELADLMMVAQGEVEDAIARLAQLARAAGIHLIIATQRPSVNVITGIIKANMPSRVAFAVSSGVDSRTILDMYGAEKLLGKGDMLFYPQGYPKPVRIQGAFVTDDEVNAVVDFLKSNVQAAHRAPGFTQEEISKQIQSISTQLPAGADGPDNGRDPYFAEAGRFIVDKEKASIGSLQRLLKVGFNRAARIMDQLCSAGVVGPEEGTKPRKILMTKEEFEAYLNENP